MISVSDLFDSATTYVLCFRQLFLFSLLITKAANSLGLSLTGSANASRNLVNLHLYVGAVLATDDLHEDLVRTAFRARGTSR
jgi:hypothetical protein